jgi:hypothetical protein
MNIKNILRLLFFSLLIAHSSLAFSWDFGFTFNQKSNVSGYGSETEFRYSGGMVPSISGLFGENSVRECRGSGAGLFFPESYIQLFLLTCSGFA